MPKITLKTQNILFRLRSESNAQRLRFNITSINHDHGGYRKPSDSSLPGILIFWQTNWKYIHIRDLGIGHGKDDEWWNWGVLARGLSGCENYGLPFSHTGDITTSRVVFTETLQEIKGNHYFMAMINW